MQNSITKIHRISSDPAMIQIWFIPNTARCVIIGLNCSDDRDGLLGYYVIICLEEQRNAIKPSRIPECSSSFNYNATFSMYLTIIAYLPIKFLPSHPCSTDLVLNLP